MRLPAQSSVLFAGCVSTSAGRPGGWELMPTGCQASQLPSGPSSLPPPRKMRFESSHFQLQRCSVLSPPGDKGPVFPPGNVWAFPGSKGERKRKWS